MLFVIFRPCSAVALQPWLGRLRCSTVWTECDGVYTFCYAADCRVRGAVALISGQCAVDPSSTSLIDQQKCSVGFFAARIHALHTREHVMGVYAYLFVYVRRKQNLLESCNGEFVTFGWP